MCGTHERVYQELPLYAVLYMCMHVYVPSSCITGPLWKTPALSNAMDYQADLRLLHQ